jgi:hypothetical protein
MASSPGRGEIFIERPKYPKYKNPAGMTYLIDGKSYSSKRGLPPV